MKDQKHWMLDRMLADFGLGEIEVKIISRGKIADFGIEEFVL
jgi:hypothetical protein